MARCRYYSDKYPQVSPPSEAGMIQRGLTHSLAMCERKVCKAMSHALSGDRSIGGTVGREGAPHVNTRQRTHQPSRPGLIGASVIFVGASWHCRVASKLKGDSDVVVERLLWPSSLAARCGCRYIWLISCPAPSSM